MHPCQKLSPQIFQLIDIPFRRVSHPLLASLLRGLQIVHVPSLYSFNLGQFLHFMLARLHFINCQRLI